jgi:hypothetical protein
MLCGHLHKVHRLRNAAAKVSAGDLDSFKSDWWSVFDHIEEPPGERAVAECLRRLDGFRANLGEGLPGSGGVPGGELRVAQRPPALPG